MLRTRAKNPRGSKKTKVIHVIGALAAGGAERFVVWLLQTMTSAELDVQLMVLSNRADVVGKQMLRSLKEAGISCDVGPTAQVGFATVLWYAKLIRKLSPSIVHLHTPNTELCHFLAGGPWLSKIVVYRTLHTTANPTQWITLLAYRFNKAVSSIACSDAVAVAARKLVAGDIVTIANGVCFEMPVRDHVNSLEHKAMLAWDLEAYHFIQVGRMSGESLASAQKAHDVVLKAWRYGNFGKRGCVLHLVGDGNLRATLESIVTGDCSVKFHGICQDVPMRLLAADCYLMPSRYEGLPIAGIEAVGSGLPCVFSEIAPLQELRPPVAFWVPVDSVEALADQMAKLAVVRPVPGKAEIEGFRRLFSIGRTADMYTDVYLGRRGSAVSTKC
jgi:glycosyltransferase involved in cell wall biosynthesis